MWIRLVAKERPVEVAWKLFSLAIVNYGQDYAPDTHAKGFNLERTLVMARRQGGNEAVERLYLAFGEAIHGRKDDVADEQVIQRCLEDAGLPRSLFQQAMADPSTEQDLRAEHDQAVNERQAFGVPTLALQGFNLAFYGPVVDPIPTGEEALALWDHTHWALTRPYLWELKRDRKFKLPPQHAI